MRQLTTAVLCTLLANLSPAGAQPTSPGRAADTAKPSPGAPVAAAPSPVEEAQPSLYYLKDKQGELQPVPNFTLEDFEDLYKLKHQLVQGDQRPRYSLQQMTATGTVVGGYAEVTIQFRVLVREDQWTRVPLRLDQAVLREPLQHQGSGEQFVHFEGNGEGYVLWIRGTAGQQHQLTLKVLVPVMAVGDETRLRLWAPRATASEFRLKVPIAGATAKVSEGATLRPPAAAGNETEFTVVGLGSDFEIVWCPPGARIAEVPAVLEASGTLSVRLDNRSVETEAALNVRSLGASFDRFRVRLPAEAQLVPGDSTSYSVVTVDEGTSSVLRQRVVEVRLPKRTTGPVEVRLATRRAHDATRPGPWVELAGFEVEGAARQWGTLAVSIVGDWQIIWGPVRTVRQIDQMPDPQQRKDVVATFEYFSQPCSLTARLVPRKTRISVDPEYVVHVDADRVRLDARLRYTVRGSKVFAVDVAMPGWTIDEMGPEGLVAGDGAPTETRPEVYSIPLLQPTMGQFELRIRAHRAMAKDAKSLKVELPEPQDVAPASAVLVVVAADNIELVPDSRATTGLLRQQGAPPVELPPRQQEPLFYRSEAAKAVLVADMRRHAQQVSVGVASQVFLDDHGSRVEQKMTYLIAYEPLDHFILEVPRGLASGQIELKHHGETVTPVALGEGQDDTSKPLRMRVALSKPCIGVCELSSRYALPAPKIASDGPATVSVPLIMPAEGQLTGNRLAVAAATELHPQPRAGAWTTIESGLPRPGQPRVLNLTAEQRCPLVEIEIQGRSGSPSAVVVDRAWVQTWFTKETRQDRAVFQLASSGREVELALPADAAVKHMVVMLDGRRVPTSLTPEGNLRISLAESDTPTRHILDLRYPMSGGRPPRGLMSLEMPRVLGDAWVRRTYWQLIVPRDEHLLFAPEGFTSESQWQWRRYYWARRPLVDQAQLEDWVTDRLPLETLGEGSRSRLPAVPEGVNCYLFSALGPVEQGEVRTISRAILVLAASGTALAFGLLLLYVRRLRRSGLLLAVAIVLTACGWICPEPATVLAQAAVLGVVLSLLAGMFAYGLKSGRNDEAFDKPAGAAVASSTISGRASYVVPVGSSPHLSSPSSPSSAAVAPPPAPQELSS